MAEEKKDRGRGGLLSFFKGNRADFMESRNTNSSKGKDRDPATQQRPGTGIDLTPKQIGDLYETNQIFQNIIDVPAEDATRDWIEFEETDQSLKDQLEKKLKDLNAQSVFEDMIKAERLRGSGFISIGTTETGHQETGPNGYILDKPINLTGLVSVDYIHPFSKLKVSGADLNANVFSTNYGQVAFYELAAGKTENTRKVHPDRLIHLKTRVFEDQVFGSPLIRSLYDPLLIFDNAAWSIGQLFYSLVFKILQSPDINLSEIGQDGTSTRQKALSQLEYEFNTLTLALIGENDKLTFASPTGSLGSIDSLINFVWEYLAGAARMPKAHILGQQQGTITGGQFDSLNYYARIAGFQENYLREKIEYLIRLLLIARDSGVGTGSIDPASQSKALYKLKFAPLWRLDKKTDAEIRKMVAETDKIYAVDIQAVTSDEIRKIRFNADPLGTILEANPDINPADLEELANKVSKARETAAKEPAA